MNDDTAFSSHEPGLNSPSAPRANDVKRLRRVHRVKTWPEFFEPALLGYKPFEVRLNDRGYEVGDVLVREEFDPVNGTHSGRRIAGVVVYVLKGGQFGIEPGYVVMTLDPCPLPD